MKRLAPRIVLPVLFLISAINTACQSNDHAIDSLQTTLGHTTVDTSRVAITFQIGRAYWFRRLIPQAVKFFGESIRLADSIHFFTYVADARILLANAYINLEKYDSSFFLLKEAMNVAAANHQADQIPKINYTYCYLYNILGDNAKALEFGLLAADGYDNSDREEINMQTVYAWIEIGHIFEIQGEFEKALYYFQKALDKAMTSDKDWYRRPAIINLANIYVKQKRYADARRFYKDAIRMDRADQGIEYQIWGYSGLGDICIYEKKYNQAEQYFKNALWLAMNHNMKTNIDNCLVKAGYAYLLDNKLDSSENYLKKGLTSAVESGGLSTMAECYNYLSQLYEKTKEYQTALYFHLKFKAISDSISTQNKTTVINNLEALYQSNKKEKSIVDLQAKNNAKEVELLKRNRWLLVTGICTIGLLSLLGVAWRNNKKNKMIARQAETIQNQKIISLQQEQKVIALKSMLSGQEQERARIARDLHDGLSGMFSTIKMHLSTLQHEHGFLKSHELFQKSYRLVDAAAADIRNIAHNMMPEVLQKMGLMQALRDLCSSFNAKGSLQVSLHNYGMEERLPKEQEIIVFRIIQELLNNVVKHSGASEVIVQFNRDRNQLGITVEDNGCGFTPVSGSEKPHAGLDIIRERTSFLNGTCSIDSRPGIGTSVMIMFDIEKTSAYDQTITGG